MTLLICGAAPRRDSPLVIPDGIIERAIAASPWAGMTVDVLIHGDARGIDRIAHRWALQGNATPVPVPARWRELGRKAGNVRNHRMCNMLTAARDDGERVGCLAIPSRWSRGTWHMVRLCQAEEIETFVYDEIRGAKR